MAWRNLEAATDEQLLREHYEFADRLKKIGREHNDLCTRMLAVARKMEDVQQRLLDVDVERASRLGEDK